MTNKRVLWWALGLVFFVMAARVLMKDDQKALTIAVDPRSFMATINRISVSADESLIGIVSSRGREVIVKVLNSAGEVVYEDSLAKFHPPQVTVSNKITFSPDGKFAAMAVNDSRNDVDSRILLLDLSRKQTIDLGAKDRWGDLAYCYDCQNGPIWLDNTTLTFVHRLKNSAQELVFVNLDGREVLPRKQFFYDPALSHSGTTLACHATNERAQTEVVLIDIAKDGPDFIAKPHRVLAAPFRNVSHFSWSPDDKQLAFSYMTEESSDKGINPVAVYGVDTGKLLFHISDYVSSPQWLDNKYLMTGYWVSTPFQGQNVHTFSGFIVFDVPAGLVTDMTIKTKSENLLVLPNAGKMVTINGGGLVVRDIDAAFSSMSEYEENTEAIVANSHKIFGINNNPGPTSLNVGSWKSYRNNNFGISFKYPADWQFIAAAGDGYMNLMLGKGTDGIEINLTSLGDEASNPSFEEGFLTRAAKGHFPYPTQDLTKMTIGDHEFFRARAAGIEESTLNLMYYLNAPLVSKAFPQFTMVMVFSLKSFLDMGADSNGEENPSHQVLKTILSTVWIDKKAGNTQ